MWMDDLSVLGSVSKPDLLKLINVSCAGLFMSMDNIASGYRNTDTCMTPLHLLAESVLALELL